MAVVVCILLFVLWLFIRAKLADAGPPIRSAASLRHQRQKARRLGMPFDEVEVRPRNSWPPGPPQGESPVVDFWAVLRGIVMIPAFTIGGAMLIVHDGGSGDLAIMWLLGFPATTFGNARPMRCTRND